MRNVLAAAFAAALVLGAPAAWADEAKATTVAALQQDKTSLAGKSVRVKGKVIKVNNGIMGRNFVHVQDGTSGPDGDKIIATSQQTANVGDQVTVTGLVVVNRDFGSGYMYPLLLEEASIAPAK